jgi:hypothetical protein
MQEHDRHRIASLAHAKAHEVLALREVVASIDATTTVDQVLVKVNRMIEAREQQVTLMGCGVAGHA